MPLDARPFNAYDTVEITGTHPIQELHGARGTIALPLCHSVLLAMHTHDENLQYTDYHRFTNFGPFLRVLRAHLLNRNIPPDTNNLMVNPTLALELTEPLALTDRLPLFEHCTVHNGALMLRRIKNGRHWYSHKAYSPDYPGGFRWCHGYLPWYQSPAPSDWNDDGHHTPEGAQQ